MKSQHCFFISKMADSKKIVKKMDWDAKVYSKRKDTPEEIISKIMHHLKEQYKGPLDIAVDVGCGTGQSSVALAPFFNKVYGLDSIDTQIKEAESSRLLDNIIYRTSPAETLPFEDSSVQLITAATSLHWFDLDKFFPESKRVLCDNGILAVYGYTKMKPLLKSPSAMEEIEKLYVEYYKALDPYFMPKARIMIQNYQNTHFPFEKVIRETDVRGLFQGRLSDVCDYIATYSAMKSFLENDPDKAQQTKNTFQKRLYEIAAEENISPDEPITLFIDFILIICRNNKS